MANILIVEDDLVVADMMELVLLKASHRVCGIARSVAEAVLMAERHRPDLMIIDVRLGNGGQGTDIARISEAAGQAAILYATGNTSAMRLSAIGGHACIAKPYSFPDLVRSAELAIELKLKGTASPPYPRGFQVLPQPLHRASELAHG